MKQIEKFGFKSGDIIISDKYEIIERIGKGYEGEVYRGKEKSTGIERSLKFYFPDKNKAMKASRAYAKKLFKLRDCSVLIPYHAHEVIKHKGQKIVVLITDYIEGSILSDFIKSQPGKRLTSFQAIHLLHALASGIAEIHLFNEYHGDLHTDNIIVRQHGLSFELKFLDFFSWSIPKYQNMKDDVCEIIKIFYEASGGKKHYKKQPQIVKDLCCGLKKSLILKKFKSASELKLYLENINW